MVKTQCDICNQKIEDHLRAQKKSLCFACLTEEVSSAGAVATFNLKEKPIQAPCAICDVLVTGSSLVPSPWGFICRNCCDYCETQTGLSWESVKLASQREWLVKANSRILGPFTEEEVISRLQDNQLVPFDEVSRPFGRWHLLRDEDLFRTIVNEIKNRNLAKVDRGETTASGSYDTSQQTQTLDVVPERPFIRPETLMGNNSNGTEATAAPSREAPPLSSSQDVQKSRDLLRTYAFRADPKVVSEIQSSGRRKVYIALGVLLVVGIFAAFRITQPREGSSLVKNRTFEEVMQQALKAEKIGDYQKALTYFAEARTFKPNDSELLLHLAPLTFLYDRQVLQAERMFKEILDTEKGPNYQKAANLGLGLIALDSHELDRAQGHFVKALTIDPEYIPAKANLGVVAFYRNELELAQSYLLNALEKGPDGALVVTLADVNIARYDSPKDRQEVINTHKTLEAYLNLAQDYEQEVLVQESRIMSLVGKPAEAMKKIDALLDVDPEKTDLHIHDWGIYRGRASWGLLLETLKKVASDLNASPRITAAVGLAMYKGREKLDGAQSIEQALSQAPRDPLLMALAGWVELKLGRRETAVLNIKEASMMPDKLKLPHILQARLCQEEKDFECARRHWQIVLSYDSRSVEAMHGLAMVEWNRRNFDGTNYWLRQAQAVDPNYIPLLQLNQEMQAARP